MVEHAEIDGRPVPESGLVDYVGNPLKVGMKVCVGWKTADEIKRTGTITWFKNGYVILDPHSQSVPSASCVVSPGETLAVS